MALSVSVKRILTQPILLTRIILIFSRYNLIRADHPSNSKRGGVCINYKDSLAVQTLNNIGVPECLVCKVSLGNKTGYLVVTYRSPGQTSEISEILTQFRHITSKPAKS